MTREDQMWRLLLATTNPGKLKEMRALLAHLEIPLSDPIALGLDLEVEEDGADYAANATAKAAAFAKASGIWALADDTGLEVDALGGEPGLHSRRVAGNDPERRQRLLTLLAPFPRPWTAVFRCAVALAGPDEAVAVAHGECPGEILPAARGTGGFGYDPLFLVAGTKQTMAELSLEEKNRISHRARAVRAITPQIVARVTHDPLGPRPLASGL
jgi:XTP/dITP diphosphohydrolase